MDINQAISGAFETAINRYLSLDPEGLSRFSVLAGHIIEIEIKGTEQSLFLFPSNDGFLVLSDFDGEADATISGTVIALTKLGLAKDARDVLFDGEITISGDTRIANQFNRLLKQLNIDWEELLSKAVGDIAAHKIGNVIRDVSCWLQRSSKSVCLDGGEYLQEEARLSPSNAELRQFINKVDEARETADRISARLHNLINKKQNNHD